MHSSSLLLCDRRLKDTHYDTSFALLVPRTEVLDTYIAVIAAIAVRNARQNLEAPGAANSCLFESPSPASQLPPEIWGIIQRYVIDAEDWACAQNACTSSFDAPITALQVTS